MRLPLATWFGRRAAVPVRRVAGVRPSGGESNFSISGTSPEFSRGRIVNETKIHRRLDVLFFQVLNDVLRKVDRATRGRALYIDRRMRLGKKFWVDLRIRLSSRKGGAA